MKKLALILIVVILLFSGCNNGYRDVELTDFEYIYSESWGSNCIKVLLITFAVDIENFSINYVAVDYDDNIIDTFYIDVGDVMKDRTYKVLISSYSNNVISNDVSDIEIISATGKVKK